MDDDDRSYPIHTLNHLERDPVVWAGCSYAEMVSSAVRWLLICFVPMFISTIIFLPVWVSLPISFVAWLGASWLSLFKLAKLRADKPLFYEIHLVKKKRTAVFIRAGIRYQRERN